MNMFEELKAWADKHNVRYRIRKCDHMLYIYFESQTYSPAAFAYNTKTGDFGWDGGD